MHVDASTAHLEAAREETARRGHTAQVTFLRGDLVTMADQVASADLVTLDRVICCYHDMAGLVATSARRALRFYGAVYPRRAPWMSMALGFTNLLMRLRRSPFRVFLHDPDAIDGVLRAVGLRRRFHQRTLAWEVVVYERV
jgi:magnesium-protoporphyrin O-methyltransferase